MPIDDLAPPEEELRRTIDALSVASGQASIDWLRRRGEVRGLDTAVDDAAQERTARR